jgi:hypothetical protein
MRTLKSGTVTANGYLASHAKRTFRSIALMCGLVFGTFGVTLAQPVLSPPAPVAYSGSTEDWTVLTMAPDGAWGAATDEYVNLAIARAIANCKKMTRAELGCGAAFKAIQAGWSLGFRCGEENIIVAESTLSGAEQAAINGEISLRQEYVPQMPPCRRVVTVDPRGVIVDRPLDVSERVDIQRR